jgi:hypothetical protein
MPISTVDVVTNIVSGVETLKNATCVVFCQRTGNYETLDSTYETSISYTDLENRYSDRFDDTTYYTIGTQTIVGG